MRKILLAAVFGAVCFGLIGAMLALNIANGGSASEGQLGAASLSISQQNNLPAVTNSSNPEVVAEGQIGNVTKVVDELRLTNPILTSQPTSGAPAIHPPGTSIGSSSNWAGYQVYNSTSVITDVVGTWEVQTAGTSNNHTYSSQWAGIGGGGYSGDDSLVQTGTESDYNSGALYYAWYEYDPKNNTQTRYSASFTIHQGDDMIAHIYLISGSTWNFSLIDWTTGVGYFADVNLNSHQVPSRKYAEWIDERSTTPFSSPYPHLTNFATAFYGPAYTSTGYNYAGINSLYANYIGNWPNIIEWKMYNNSGAKLLAFPGSLGSDKESFVVTRTPNQTA
jgi:hypothetical protein